MKYPAAYCGIFHWRKVFYVAHTYNKSAQAPSLMFCSENHLVSENFMLVVVVLQSHIFSRLYPYQENRPRLL
jgi:hypothetical protein